MKNQRLWEVSVTVPAKRATSLANDGGQSARSRVQLPVIFGRRLSAHSLAVFYRSLATMFAAGVRIDRALTLLGDQVDDPVMAEISRGLARSVSQGVSLSHAMTSWPDVFTTMHQRLVMVGEARGPLDDILDQLGIYEEKRRALGMRLSSALTYPIILFVLAMVALVFVPPYLFGGLFQLIESSGVDIPFVTRIMLAVSRTVTSGWFYLAAGIALVVALKLLPPILRQPKMQRELFALAFRTPVIGPALRTVTVTRFARTMEVLVAVGISLDQAFEMSFAAAGNPLLAEKLPAALESLRAGGTIEESLAGTGFFPNAFLQMVAVGEESGKLPHLISRLADIYEVELEYSLEVAVTALEPIMLLLMGLVVGFVVIATMLPMMQVIQNL